MSVLINALNNFNRLSFPNKVVVYLYLRNSLRLDETQRHIHLSASDAEYFVKLLDKKKEVAILDLYQTIPYIHVNNPEVKNALLKILPVFLSYSTLYEMKTSYVSQILDMLKVHPAFSNHIHIFTQWFVVFDKHRLNKTRMFNYKDEFYFQNLPPLEPVRGDYFSTCVGYSDVALLRAFHRWLRLHRLHKYLFVFSNLTYEEIITIDETNIDEVVNSVGIITMTIGAKNKVLRELEELRNRRMALMNNVILKLFQNSQDVEDAIRTIKKTMRTPIKVNDGFNENIPQMIVRALKTVCEVIIRDVVPFNEGMIPLFGLLISVLKEAWNYTIFSTIEKDCFNSWRSALSEKINNNFTTFGSLSASRQFSQSTSTLCLPDLLENFRIQ